MNTSEGSAVMSDTNGNLLFYTDGNTVWNKYHDTMSNGAGLNGSMSSVQSSVIVKQPGNTNIYYLFTTDIRFVAGFKDKGLCYSIVDINADGGLGAITLKNQPLMDLSIEKLCATMHFNEKDFWIASAKNTTDSIYLFLLDETGLKFKSTTKINNFYTYIDIPTQMKFSSDGKYLAYANGNGAPNQGEICWLDFDNINGVFTNPRRIKSLDKSPYGLEFSPNGKYLYFTLNIARQIYQVDLAKFNSNIHFSNYSNLIFDAQNVQKYFGSMQLAPDGKIYFVRGLDSFLSSIDDPNQVNCQLNVNAVKLKKGLTLLGLPSFATNYIFKPIHIFKDTFCITDTAFFNINAKGIDSIQWDFGDGNKSTFSYSTAKHFYKDSGNFLATGKIFWEFGKQTMFSSEVRVEFFSDLIQIDTTLCMGDSLVLKTLYPKIFKTLWDNGSSDSIRVFKQTGDYWLKISNQFCNYKSDIRLKFAQRPLVFIGNDTLFCGQFNQVLNAGRGYKSYSWNTGETTYFISVNQKGHYNVRVLDSNACHASDSIDINQIIQPKISLSFDSILCQYVYLNAEKIAGNQYLWSNGDTGSFSKVNQKGKYYLNVSNSTCKFKDSILVELLAKPEVNLGPDTSFCRTLTLYSNETGKHEWSDGSARPSLQVISPDLYWVKVSRNNCSNTDTIFISKCQAPQYYIPNAFSPNGDQINDVFKVYGNNIKEVKMQIFNRWGEQLFMGNEWNGTYDSEVCMQGSYLYYIVVEDLYGTKHYLKGMLDLMD